MGMPFRCSLVRVVPCRPVLIGQTVQRLLAPGHLPAPLSAHALIWAGGPIPSILNRRYAPKPERELI